MSSELDVWNTKSSKEIADCRVFKVRRETSENSRTGDVASFFVLESPDWVNVLPLTSDEQVVLIEQYRHGTGELTVEIPGGMVDEGESPAECARRELEEETGYRARNLVYLGGSMPNPAIQSNRLHHFLAVGCERASKPRFDEHESIANRLIPLEDLNVLVDNDVITHSLVLACLLRFERFRGSGAEFCYES